MCQQLSASDETKFALERYRIVAAYLQYENTVYWQRGQLFLVASTALFGFSVQNLPLVSSGDQPIERVIVCAMLSIAGLILAWLWHRSLMAGEFWLHHWHALLRSLEKSAFGDHLLFRDFTPDSSSPPRVRARSVTVGAVRLFYFLWGLLLAYSIVVLLVRCCSC